MEQGTQQLTQPQPAPVKQRKRMHWLDVMRGFCMFLVVIGHVQAMPYEVTKAIYAFHMPTFFMISGALFRYEKYPTFLACLKDKAFKLLVPYVTMYIICIPIWALTFKVVGSTNMTLWQVVLGMFAGNDHILPVSSTALWFLPCLFGASIIYWLVVHLNRKLHVPVLVSMIVVFAVGALVSVFWREPTIQHWATMPMATVFYYLGHVCMGKREVLTTALHSTQEKPASWQMVVVAILLLAIGFAAGWFNGRISMMMNSYHNFALMLICAWCMTVGLTLVFMQLPKIPVLNYAGINSIVFLGFHLPFIRFFETLPATAGISTAAPFLLGIVVFLLMVPVSYVVNRWAPWIIAKPFAPKPAKTKE